jgi:hypothetical protein
MPLRLVRRLGVDRRRPLGDGAIVVVVAEWFEGRVGDVLTSAGGNLGHGSDGLILESLKDCKLLRLDTGKQLEQNCPGEGIWPSFSSTRLRVFAGGFRAAIRYTVVSGASSRTCDRTPAQAESGGGAEFRRLAAVGAKSSAHRISSRGRARSSGETLGSGYRSFCFAGDRRVGRATLDALSSAAGQRQ